MTDYSAITILICILMVAMAVHVLTYSGFNSRQKAWFALTFFSITFCSLAEFAVHCGYYNKTFAIPLTILTVIQFSLSPCLAMLFAGALGFRYQGKIAIAFFAFNLIIEIIGAPFGAVFSFNADGYFRGSYFLLYEISYIGSLGYLIIVLFLAGKRFKRRDLPTIISIFLILLGGIIPMTFFSIHVAYAAIGISSAVCYIYYNDLVQQDIKEELVKEQKRISDMQEHTISGLASLIESRDTETGGHIVRTSALVKMVAEQSVEEGLYKETLTPEFISRLCTLAPMHDVGKIVVSDQILKKPGKLTKEEFEAMKKHAAMGGKVVREILSGITDEDYLKFASDIATYHHERWDGTGYPSGLSQEAIPLSARIMAIADVYDALISKRCYKEAMTFTEAMKTMEEESGTHFDPKLIAVFLKNKESYRHFCQRPE
ncbi:MAG: HD domain-containing protein [Bacilli bacterium]|nr:HD domain-containing protein [Bacilli bacterium]